MAEPFEPRFADLVRNYTSTIGTGSFVLGAAVTGYQSFASAIQPGERFHYSAISTRKPSEFEVGRGTLLADGSISREPVGGTPTDFTEGEKTIALVAAAEWFEAMQASAASGVGRAESRAALAGIEDRSKPMLLTEAGRTGLFTFDPTDLAGSVAADPAQGVYVAPVTDPSGVSGAWVRRYSGALDARWFGAAGDGVTDDTVPLQAALTYFENAGSGVLKLGDGTYLVSAPLLLLAPDVTVDARGATLVGSSSLSGPIFYVGADRDRVIGGTWRAPRVASRQFDIEARECHLDGCIIEHVPDADTVQMYVRYGSDGFNISNCRFSGANEAMFLEASNVVIAGNEFQGCESIGGDDCIAIKAIQGVTENIRIFGNHMRRHAAMVSFGSNIGTIGVDDPTYSRRVRNVTIVGNTGERCAYGLYIKPGAVAVDYRNGVVENVTFSDNVLHDPLGDMFERAIAITAGRGALVRNIGGDNNVVIARASGTGATGPKVAMPIVGGSGAAATFENIDVQLTFRDPYGGVASGGSAPGYPIANIVTVQPNGAAMRGINLRVDGSGCAGAGIYIYPGVDDAVTISRARLDTINLAATADGGITTNSRIRVGNDISITMASGNPYRLVSGTSAEIVGNGETVFFAESIPAGTDQIRRPWCAPRNAFVHRIELLNATAISQSTDDSNYTQLELRNIGGNSNIFHSVSSKLTGGQAFPADVFNTVLNAREITNASNQGQCFFARGAHLYVNKNDFGAGNAISRAYMRVQWAPY